MSIPYPFYDTRASLIGLQRNDAVCDNSLSARERGFGEFRCTCNFQTTVLVPGIRIIGVKSEGYVAGHLLHTLGGGWVELPGGKISRDEIVCYRGISAPDDYDYTDDLPRRKGVRYKDDEDETK